MTQLFKKIKRKVSFLWSINWTKALYFNFKMLPFRIAVKLPVFFYGSVKFSSLKGQIKIEAPLKTGMLGFGQSYELTTRSRGIAELFLDGTLLIKGHVAVGKDYFICIKHGAYCEIGHMTSMGTLGKLICTHKIILGDWVRIGYESQLIDTNFHPMVNVVSGEQYPINGVIEIGNYIYIGTQVIIYKNTKIPSYCSITSMSLCNKDYTNLNPNSMIGGVPATFIKDSISRDWKAEEELMKNWLIINI